MSSLMKATILVNQEELNHSILLQSLMGGVNNF